MTGQGEAGRGVHSAAPEDNGAEVIRLPDHRYEHIPEQFRPHEYAFDQEFTTLPLRSINMLAQTRHGRNDQQTNLEQSIETMGLQSFTEVAQFDDAHYLAYARVVMYRFGKVPSDEELLSMVKRHDDGFIYVVSFGHSRTKAIIHNEEKRSEAAKAAGFKTDPYGAIVRTMVKYNPLPDELMVRQITENLHSRPPAEHIAGDVLSLYNYLKQTKQLRTQNQFYERFGGKLPESTFETIINFGYLPPDIQESVFNDPKVAFVVAARVGALVPHWRALEAYKLTQGTRPLTSTERRSLNRRTIGYARDQYGQIRGAIYASRKDGNRFGINLQIQRLDNTREGLIEALKNEGASLWGTTLEDWGMTSQQLEENELLLMRKRARKAITEVLRSPLVNYERLAEELGALVNLDPNPASRLARQRYLLGAMMPLVDSYGVVVAGELPPFVEQSDENELEYPGF